MTHYRLTLTKGRGPKVHLVAERHALDHIVPSGWYNALRTGASIHVRMCWTPDDACEHLTPASPHTPTPSPKG